MKAAKFINPPKKIKNDTSMPTPSLFGKVILL